MTIFTLEKRDNGLYAVYENGKQVKNPIFQDEKDFIEELAALGFTPYQYNIIIR